MNSNDLIAKVDRLWLDLDHKLKDHNTHKKPDLPQAQLALMETDEAIRTLKSWVITHQFDSWQKEIHFFKYLKPKFVAKFIFLSKVVAFYSGLPYGGDKLVKKKIETEFETMRIFSEDNSEFINYYRRQSTYLDKKYFLRFQYDLYVRLSLDLHSFDDRFSTAQDYLVAHILSNDDYEGFLKKHWQQVKKAQEWPDTPAAHALQWTGSKAALTELVFALALSGSFNHGNTDLAEMVRHIEKAFATDLGNYHKTFSEIRARKSSPVKFLTHLSDILRNHIDNTDD